MKKIISVVLSLTILLTCICGLNFNISAEDTAETVSVLVTDNNYDESNVTYTNSGTLSSSSQMGVYTTRTVNNETTIEHFSYWDTLIEQTTDVNGLSTYAAHFGCHQNGDKATNIYPNVLRIYDSTSETLEQFTPKANTTYTIKLSYNSLLNPNGTSSGKNLSISLMYANKEDSSVQSGYVADNVIIESLALIEDVTDGWQTVEATFTTGDTVMPLLLILQTDNNKWWSTNVDVWVDDIQLYEQQVVEPALKSVINNYDESNVTYTNSGTLSTSAQQNLYTTRVVNGETTIEHFAYYDAQIEQTTDANGLSTYATHFGCHQNPEGAAWKWNNTVRIYDSDSETLDQFIPDVNSTYTIKLNYRVDMPLTDGKNLILKLIYANKEDSSEQSSYSEENVILNRLAYIDTDVVTSEWQTAEASFTTGETVMPLLLILQSDSTSGWSTNVDLWVDNIEITQTAKSDETTDAETPVDTELNTDSFLYEAVIDEDFSDVAVGELPDGWIRDYAHTFLWAGGNATGLTGDTVGVQAGDNGNYLKYSSASGGHIITLPELGTRNYRFTATVSVDALGDKTFGLVTDLIDDYESATSANISGIKFSEDENGEVSLITREYYNGKDFSGRDAVKELYDAANYFEGGLPAVDTDIVFTCYHYEGVTYFYIDGKFVGSLNDYSTASNTRIGFYSYGASVKIKSVNADAIYEASEIEELIYADEIIVDEDFSNSTVGEMPENWSLYSGSWTWNGDKGTAVTEETDGTKNLKVTSDGGTAAVILPTLGTSDYVLTANVKLISTKGSVGLLTNIKDPVSSSTGATHMLTYISGEKDELYIYNRTGGSQNDKITLTASETLGFVPAEGDELTLTAYNYQGKSYFFINGIFVTVITQASPETAQSLCGLYACGATVQVNSVTVDKISPRKLTDALVVNGVSARYASPDGSVTVNGGGIKFRAAMNTADAFYTENADNLELGMLFIPTEEMSGNILTVTTRNAANLLMGSDYTESENKITFVKTLLNLAVSQMDKEYTVRAYAKVTTADGVKYYYSDAKEYTPTRIAELEYLSEKATEEVKDKMETMFADSNVFVGEDITTLTFSLFSDFHYKENMYASTIADLETILSRANENNVDFIIHGGDFTNDAIGSPELYNTYLNNSYGLPAYGIYGNHELESAGNSMQVATPLLTNQADNVVWGTADGKIGDSSIGYYYYDVKGFRIVCTDTNYSYNPTTLQWEHNTTSSYGPPSGNLYGNSLGPVQLQWLENVLVDAAKNKISCIVLGHASFYGFADSSPDTAKVQNIFAKANKIYDRTVMMAINGHYHTNRINTKDNVLYFDCNTVFNGYWSGGTTEQHYTDGQTFEFVSYDSEGNPVSSYDRNLNELTQAKNTYFFTDPLSAIVKISNNGQISIEGMETTWRYDVVPENDKDYITPKITSGEYLIK